MRGITIIDLTRVLAGPWAAQQLADQGAEVIKIEPPTGDETRSFGPIVNGESTYYLSANRNKRAMTLNLKSESGRTVLRRLLENADVVLENFRAGVAERLGIGFEELSALNPRLVYVTIKAFGSTGSPEWTQRPGYDLVLQAMGGAVSFTGFPDSQPSKCGLSIADTLAGMLAVQAVLTGLLQRERSGKGQRIEINMMQAQAAALSYHATRFTVTGEEEVRRGNAHRGLAPYNIFQCSDGPFAFACGNDRIWLRAVKALGLKHKPEWSTNPGRIACREAVDAEVQAKLEKLTVAEADKLCAEADIPAGPVQGIQEALEHPAVELIEVEHPALGLVTMPGPFFKTEDSPEVHQAPPQFDQHRAEILTEYGFTPSQISDFEEGGAFSA